MDHTLRRYQKRYAADPYDAEAAGEYIRVLERTLRGGGPIEDRYEFDLHVMRYVPAPGEITERTQQMLEENAAFVGYDGNYNNSPDMNDLIIPVLAPITELRKRHPLHRAALRAQARGYRYIYLSLEPYHISETYRRQLAERDLEGTLSGLREEARELAEMFKSGEWRPDLWDSYTPVSLLRTPLYRYLILPKDRTPGHHPNMAAQGFRRIVSRWDEWVSNLP